jgi:hypothetical protein
MEQRVFVEEPLFMDGVRRRLGLLDCCNGSLRDVVLSWTFVEFSPVS